MNNIKDLRDDILNIDSIIIKLLSQRMKISQNIGKIKKENNFNILQKDVWENGNSFRSEIAQKENINLDFINDIFELIHIESIKIQENI